MKAIFIFSLITVAMAAPPIPAHAEDPHMTEIVQSEFKKEPDGSYMFKYEGADGTYREEKGIVLHPGVENSPVEVEGLYRYIDMEQKVVEVNYKANEHGFVPEGASIDPAITSNARSLSEMMMH